MSGSKILLVTKEETHYLNCINENCEKAFCVSRRDYEGKLLASVVREQKLAELASQMLQDHLDDYGYEQVENWSPEMEEQLGWGENCTAVQLGRLLKEISEEKK